MSTRTSLHPELILGPNPFLEPLPQQVEYQQLPLVLTRQPLRDVDVWSMPPAQRESLLQVSEKHFVATSEVLEIAAGIQILLRRSLMLLNATNKAERIRINRVSMAQDIDRLKSIPKVDGAGMLIEGVTGTGKSAVVRRTLEILVPDQMIEHGQSAVCDYYKLRQVYYLHIDQPSNGTRGALLKRILLELDSVLGTDYAQKHHKTNNLDTLLVVVAQRLAVHRVALLVIDEKQEGNFADQPWSVEFVLFYMMLMNLGVSVVLLGNPLAFTHLKDFSQVMRRFSTGGVHTLLPATEESAWWPKWFVPGARKFDLIEQWALDEAWRRSFELTHAGGLPGLYMLLHREVMRSALRRGGSTACVTQADFQAALKSPRYKEAARIARSTTSTSAEDMTAFIDIPPLPPRARSKPENSEATGPAPKEREAGPIPPVTAQRLTNMVTGLKKQQTRELNKMQQRIDLTQKMSPEDARLLGVSDELIQSMQRLLNDKPGSKSRSKRK